MANPHLPPDILAEIPLHIRWTQGDRDGAITEARRACCLASRLFLSAARRGLFHSVILDGRRDREKGLADSPHLTAHVKCLCMLRKFGDNIANGCAATIFKNVSNIAVLGASNFQCSSILADRETHEAFTKHLAPLVRTLKLESVLDFGRYFSYFTGLNTLKLARCTLWKDPGTDYERISQLTNLHLTGSDAIQDNELAILTQVILEQGCRLRELQWYPIRKPRTATVAEKPGHAFRTFFAAISRTLVNLTICSCSPFDVDQYDFPPERHPWNPQNFPLLEILRIPLLAKMTYRGRLHDTWYKENICWVVGILRCLTFHHPLKTLSIMGSPEDFQKLPGWTPWHQLEDTLQSAHLSSLQDITICWYCKPNTLVSEEAREAFSKKHLPHLYERGMVHSVAKVIMPRVI
ncbi:hypothetical protein DL96DRAFT_1817128 [Flagelloscypha sp. PMI_526]|nr:hypothetical protein DL96DRAFT_1817128 [Flagelloscypha sp. PMI_526]